MTDSPGAVDERLIAENRLRKLASAEQLVLSRRDHARADVRIRRDPQVLLDLLLSPVIP